MGLVELRERIDEPAVRALLEAAHRGSLEAAVDQNRARDWVLVGWEEDGVLVASAGVERVTSEEVRLRSVAVAPERRARGIGRALVGALAEVAAARRLVAETDADSSGFSERCGFAVEPAPPKGGRASFRCTRVLEPRAAAPEAVSAATLGGREGAIRES